MQPQPAKKDYAVINTLDELRDYLNRCIKTGVCSFDYETAASDEARAYYTPKLNELKARIAAAATKQEQKELEKEYADLRATFLATPLDPWQSQICTISLAAAEHEARVVFISHKKGRNISATREEVFDLLEKMIFHNPNVLKIAVNLAFETKQSAALGKYILSPVADPFVMWVRCIQVGFPKLIPNPKQPASGKGLKPMTKQVFGVTMGNFLDLLKKWNVNFFDEIPAGEEDAVIYSAEDSDYSLQHYNFWCQIAKQIPRYYEWLHEIEMPFSRVIGLMEYWGMEWDQNTADVKRQEAENKLGFLSEEIKRLIDKELGKKVEPGKTGKTKEIKTLIFDELKAPASKWGINNEPSLDEESIIDIKFMLQNKLLALSEEKYLEYEAQLPPDWETIDYHNHPGLSTGVRKLIEIKRRDEFKYKDLTIKILDLIQQMQTYSTLLSSHIIGRQKYLNRVSGRIHAQYTPWTETSRLNSSKPNGQNVPRMDNDVFGIRNFYRAPGKGKSYSS